MNRFGRRSRFRLFTFFMGRSQPVVPIEVEEPEQSRGEEEVIDFSSSSFIVTTTPTKQQQQSEPPSKTQRQRPSAESNDNDNTRQCTVVRFADESTIQRYDNTQLCKEDVASLCWLSPRDYQAIRFERLESARQAREFQNDSGNHHHRDFVDFPREKIFEYVYQELLLNQTCDEGALLSPSVERAFADWMQQSATGGYDSNTDGPYDDDDDDDCWWGLERVYCTQIALDRRIRRIELSETLTEIYALDQLLNGRVGTTAAVVVATNDDDDDDDNDNNHDQEDEDSQSHGGAPMSVEERDITDCIAAQACQSISRPSELFARLWAQQVQQHVQQQQQSQSQQTVNDNNNQQKEVVSSE